MGILPMRACTHAHAEGVKQSRERNDVEVLSLARLLVRLRRSARVLARMGGAPMRHVGTFSLTSRRASMRVAAQMRVRRTPASRRPARGTDVGRARTGVARADRRRAR